MGFSHHGERVVEGNVPQLFPRQRLVLYLRPSILTREPNAKQVTDSKIWIQCRERVSQQVDEQQGSGDPDCASRTSSSGRGRFIYPPCTADSLK